VEPRRVRIVEDNDDIAFMLARQIESDAPHLDATMTTTGFPELLAPEPWEGIDAAVVDVMLPGISGIDILRWLAEYRPGIRRVAMTAGLIEATEATGYAHCVLIKPFHTRDLVEALR
jgi:DNA-binding response OmpR family regulator